MSSLSLSTDNIISLTKLESAVRREYGQRHTLAEESSLLQLLKLAAESTNQTIQLAFFQFLEGLNQQEKDKLIYRGVAVSKDTKVTPPSDKGANPQQIMYRGQPVQRATPAAGEPEKVAPKKATRIYRGRVIAD